jgi:hypothetical protein
MSTAAPAVTDTGVALAPADRFFVCTVALDPGEDAAARVEMALEEISPFPLPQLYYGHVVAPAGGVALGFAAYRRRFTAAEAEAWPTARAVLPAFLALVGEPPGEPLLVVHAHAGGLTGAAWNGGPLPAAVLARTTAEAPGEAQRDEFVADLRAVAGLPAAEVRLLEGEIGLAPDAAGGLIFRIGDRETARLDPTALGAADVREKNYLQAWRREHQRDRLLWRAWLGLLGLIALAAALEAGATGLALWSNRRHVTLEAQAGPAHGIETAQTLAARIEDLSNRRLLPLEMLTVVSEQRPPTVQFLRTATKGLLTLELEAQTPNAADAGAFETALRKLAEVERVETREMRSRDGVTTFLLAVTFKPGALRPEGGAP